MLVVHWMKFDGTLCKLLTYPRRKKYCEMFISFTKHCKKVSQGYVLLLSPMSPLKSLFLPDRHPGGDGFVEGGKALSLGSWGEMLFGVLGVVLLSVGK